MALLTSDQAASRLGVKVQTLYAYVSRGVLTSVRAPDGRASQFVADEVEALARRGRPRRAGRTPTFEIQIDSGLTSIADHSLRYRGRSAVDLATTATFEQVAELCWTGALPPEPAPWSGSTVPLPHDGDLIDRVRVAVALAAIDDPSRADLRPEAVAACGRSLIATVVDSLPIHGDGRSPRLLLSPGGVARRGTIAGRLWARLASARPQPDLVAALNAALVLLADHDLAASTFAVRIAASVRADPYAAVSTGLGPLSGPLHGRASRAARVMLDAADGPGGAAVATADALRTWGAYPGFGQRLYPNGDPRAVALLGLLRRAAGGSRAMAVVDGVVAAAQRRALIHPNVDFALAALGRVTNMPQDAGEVIFAVARMAGWIAHAMEEYEEAPARFRPRASYRPRPAAVGADEPGISAAAVV
jgi:citrate synthase